MDVCFFIYYSVISCSFISLKFIFISTNIFIRPMVLSHLISRKAFDVLCSLSVTCPSLTIH